MRSSSMILAVGLVALAGCISQDAYLQELSEAHRQSCEALGFEAESDSMRLCEMQLETNRRLDRINAQLLQIKQDIRLLRQRAI